MRGNIRRFVSSRRIVAVIAVGTVLLSGCAGVPSSSPPQIVQSVQVQPSLQSGLTPDEGADPRAIVAGFLTNNASEDQHHSMAKAFLTPEAKNRWSDSSQTQVFDSLQIGNFDSDTDTVLLTGHLIGTINPGGSYSPSLTGDGQGGPGPPFTLPIGLKQVEGQWRIDTLPNGLLVTATQFAQFYTQYFVYFYDQAQLHLVPDPRYTTVRDPDTLATWLMTQLIGPQPPSLSTALPSIPNASQLKINSGTVLTVDLPGAGQLDTPTRDRMAAQVALTLDQVSTGAEMTITDGGDAVTIPQAGGVRFTASELNDALSPANTEPVLFYLAKGGVYDANGRPLAGGIGSGAYNLTSVALASLASTSQLLIAGTTGPARTARLLVGQTGGALKATTVTGALSRPAWAPNNDEVWVGDGPRVFRVNSAGKAQPVQLTAGVGAVSGRIVALRFSPEGARIALVIAADDGSSQIWVGDVVRSADAVRVSGLTAISPVGIAVTDVAWNDSFKLFAIGHSVAGEDGGVFEVQCDGSLWLPRGIGNLPQNPDSISVAENVVASVSAGGTVWVQHAGTWVSPTASSTTYGSNPVYLE